MISVQFCGAAREVTGSCHLITLSDGFKILLDCGLYQGSSENMSNFNERWMFNPSEIDALVLSHAHIDHCGRIPKLIKDGFRGNIFCTHPTRQLCSLLLLDSAKIQEDDAKFFNKRAKRRNDKSRRQPLYTVQDVQRAMHHFVSYGYENTLSIHPKVTVTFRDAGHILGSASVRLEIKEGKETLRFGFTGDIGRPNRPILKDPLPMKEVDYLICESTYGSRDHISNPEESEKLLKIIRHTCVEKRGKLIIPAFSVGRTQEILYMLDKMEHAKKLPKIPVYIDSPLATNATQVFLSNPECFDEELSNYLTSDPNPFGFNTLRYVRTTAYSKKLNSTKEPCIIISASGMGNAGRVKHHIFNSIDNPKNTILIVGYCSPETPGGQLRAGATHLSLFGEQKAVRADVEIMDSFSAHGDRTEIFNFIQNQKKLKKLFLVHGEYNTQQQFLEFLGAKGINKDIIEIPMLKEKFTLE